MPCGLGGDEGGFWGCPVGWKGMRVVEGCSVGQERVKVVGGPVG